MFSDCIVDRAIWTKPNLRWSLRLCNLIDMSKLFVEHSVCLFRLKQLTLHEKNSLRDFEVRPDNWLFLHFANLNAWIYLFKISTVISVHYSVFVVYDSWRKQGMTFSCKFFQLTRFTERACDWESISTYALKVFFGIGDVSVWSGCDSLCPLVYQTRQTKFGVDFDEFVLYSHTVWVVLQSVFKHRYHHKVIWVEYSRVINLDFLQLENSD